MKMQRVIQVLVFYSIFRILFDMLKLFFDKLQLTIGWLNVLEIVSIVIIMLVSIVLTLILTKESD